MSNYLAIATVTVALGAALKPAASRALQGTQVTISTRRPKEPEAQQVAPQINTFLYQVLPNAAWRNADLPTRRSDSTVLQRPQAALDVHYLLTFYGDETTLQPQRMLASCVGALHARPVLTREAIRSLIRSAQDDNHIHHFLIDSNLVEQVELVKFSPLPLNMEELSKLWSVFFQTTYTLSVAYQASVILVEEEEELPQPALPVRSYNLRAVPFSQPFLEQVMAAEGEDVPITANSTLVLGGQQLKGEVTSVLIAGEEVTPQSLSPSEIRVRLPSLDSSSIRSGLAGVQVVHKRRMEGSTTLIGSGESEVASFLLRPVVTELSVGGALLTVQLNPQPGRRQRVAVLLNQVNPAAGHRARSYSLPAQEITGDRMTFSRAGNDPALTELGLENPVQVWGIWSKAMETFAGLSNNPAHILLTIGEEGPYQVSIIGTPATLEAARAALEAGIQAAHPSVAFTAAQVISLGKRLLVLPGKPGATLTFAPFAADPVITELGLANPTPVWCIWSGDLTNFAGVSNDSAQLQVSIGDRGPYETTISGEPSDLNTAAIALQTGLRAAYESATFAGVQVTQVGNRLLIVPGFDIQFKLTNVDPGDYLVRIQVDGAESLLDVDANPASPTFGQYCGPKVTIP